jgi:hypothetical protein
MVKKIMFPMPTTQPRVNIVMDPSLYESLATMAKKEKTSLSSKANELIKLAMEIYEDSYWDKQASVRAKKANKKSLLSHDEVWG